MGQVGLLLSTLSQEFLDWVGPWVQKALQLVRRAPAGRIARGCASHRLVLPSISVNGNVTAPVGSAIMTTLLFSFDGH